MCEGVVRSGQHLALCIQKGCTQEACTKGAAPGGGGAFTTKTGSASSDYNSQGKNLLSFPVSLTARGQERVCSQAFKC